MSRVPKGVLKAQRQAAERRRATEAATATEVPETNSLLPAKVVLETPETNNKPRTIGGEKVLVGFNGLMPVFADLDERVGPFGLTRGGRNTLGWVLFWSLPVVAVLGYLASL